MDDSPRAPGPLVVARAVAVLQTVVGVVGGLLGGLEAAAASGHGNASPLSGIAVVLGGGVAVAGVVTVLLIGVPLLVLRGATPTRRVTGRGLLIGGELLLLLPIVLFYYARFGVPTGTDQWSIAVDLLLLVPVVVIVCLLLPSTRRWAYAPLVPSDALVTDRRR